jgi:hypothetical protein
MSVTVRSNGPSSVSVQQGNKPVSSVVVKKPGDLTIQSLKNVVTTDLQDGYTLVYDSATNQWVSQAVDGTVLTGVDGGTY